MLSHYKKCALACLLLAAPYSAYAAEEASSSGATAKPGILVTVNKHSVCRDVTNLEDHDLMIPARSASEWFSFYSNDPYSVKMAPGCEVAGYPAPLDEPDALTYWDIYETYATEYFTALYVKYNNTDLLVNSSGTESIKNIKYAGRDTKNATELCSRVDGSEAYIEVTADEYDYDTLYSIMSSSKKSKYLQFYADAAADVLAPESGYCTIHVHYLDDNPSPNKVRAMRINYIIGAPTPVPE
jgi:hypothetical protein